MTFMLLMECFSPNLLHYDNFSPYFLRISSFLALRSARLTLYNKNIYRIGRGSPFGAFLTYCIFFLHVIFLFLFPLSKGRETRSPEWLKLHVKGREVM